MIVDIIDETFPLLGSGNLERSPGIHLSDVLRFINTSVGRDKSGSGWKREPTQGTGLLWEIILSKAFSEEIYPRIGEVEKDGIIGTPDGFDPSHWELLEAKCTWRSSGRPITDFWDWVQQIKSYCYMLGTHRAVLRVLYLNGDYRHSGPEYRVYKLVFKPHELRETWDMILNNRDQMIKNGWKREERI